jgi:hypothetical protein
MIIDVSPLGWFHPGLRRAGNAAPDRANIEVLTARAHAAAADASHCSGATLMISPGSTEVTYPKSGQVQTGIA